MENRDIVINIGEKIKLDISSYTHEGLGVGKINGLNKYGEELINYPIFVFGMLVGETGFVEITKVNKDYALGKCLKTFNETKRKEHIMPICPSYLECGGCNIMHMNYQEQLRFKEEMVKSTLTKIGKLDNVNIEKIVPSKNVLYYRNKVQVPVSSFKDKTFCGFYERSSHRIVPLKSCLIQTETSTNLTILVKNVFNELGVKGYNENTKEGLLKHILIRKNHDESEMMVAGVVKDISFLNDNFKERFKEKILRKFPNVVSIVLSINPSDTNTILGEKSITMFGKGYITDTLCGLKFNISDKSFYQVNHDQTEVLYNTALNCANLSEDDILIDAYCGIGTIGLIAAKKVKHIYGVEIIPEAIANAKENAKINGITNINFEVGKSEIVIPKWIDNGIKPTVLIVDPPRKGCDIKLLSTILESKIDKVLYISCNPATLARDISILSSDYSVGRVIPVDMFPNTNHVETVVCLERK